MWWELNNTHKSAYYALLESNGINEATKVFMDKYERPDQRYANLSRRQRFANLG